MALGESSVCVVCIHVYVYPVNMQTSKPQVRTQSLDFYAAESHSVGFMNAQHRIYWLEEFLTNHGHR